MPGLGPQKAARTILRVIAGALAPMALCLSSPSLARSAEPPAVKAAAAPSADFRARPPQDDVIYFLLPDRFANGDPSNDQGGLSGGRLQTGFDPTDTGFYHGGDLKGLAAHLDYIQGLGATAIWLGPVFRNKPVQGPPGHESAGYHGYWITDFTDVDPHLGTRADLEALVKAAHARGMKVYLDIITNHTADVIQYRECPKSSCAYRSVAEYPYTRRGGLGGAPINAGFQGEDAGRQTAANFARLVRPDYAYTPFVPADEAHVKKPEWLNDPIYYHNRGDTTWTGESVTFGDFSGLDDLFTENPRVLAGFIDIYGAWIDRFGIDGYRIDTAKHVNPEFWRAFAPAMQARARARGRPNFFLFGEYYDPDPAQLAKGARETRLPAVLDFGFQQAVTDVVARGAGADRLARFFGLDVLYPGGEATAGRLPIFLGNHDMGRFAHFVRAALPNASDDEVLRRVILGHAMMMFSRGVPVIYYGDEQGFVGTGGDQQARQDMFRTRVAAYAADRRLGAAGPDGGDHFDTQAPIYRAIAEMARVRASDPALRSGRLVMRDASSAAGLVAWSRITPGRGETLVVFNTSTAAARGEVRVDLRSRRWRSARGSCAAQAAAPGSYPVSLPPLDYLICTAIPEGATR